MSLSGFGLGSCDYRSVDGSSGDDRLAELAGNGCEAAFSLLVSRYMPMIRHQVSSFGGCYGEFEDLWQEGLLGLLAAVRTYRSGVSSFAAYASVCVRNRLLSAVRKSGCQTSKFELVSIDDMSELTDTVSVSGSDPACLVVQREEDSRLNSRLKKLLSEIEYNVLALYLQAYSYHDIQESLGIGFKSVDNALQRVRRKLAVTPLLGE